MKWRHREPQPGKHCATASADICPSFPPAFLGELVCVLSAHRQLAGVASSEAFWFVPLPAGAGVAGSLQCRPPAPLAASWGSRLSKVPQPGWRQLAPHGLTPLSSRVARRLTAGQGEVPLTGNGPSDSQQLDKPRSHPQHMPQGLWGGKKRHSGLPSPCCSDSFRFSETTGKSPFP